ncbi:hypothetical protein DFJ63DRAFT_184844 [Scheffersomyces coipomensis]|uniref:uncharacterized protein n=1 Tax=Scheffersomyces coipomensis TaxID=1788519 RepID=UPI00315DD356
MSLSNRDNIFESINLNSAFIQPQQNNINSTNINNSNGSSSNHHGTGATISSNLAPIRSSNSIPHSLSGTSDDDDELDLAEFISDDLQFNNNNPRNLPDSNEHSSQLNASTILGDSDRKSPIGNRPLSTNDNSNILINPSFPINGLDSEMLNHDFQQQSQMLPSVILGKFPIDLNSIDIPKNDDETPLEFLTSKNGFLLKEMHKNIQIHESYLGSGDENLNKLRSMIFQNFEQLSLNYYSLNEIYAKDISYTESLTSSFQKWDKNRSKILSRIQNIKSDKNKHGAKLSGLLDESNSIDVEIGKLEKQLQSLRQKKVLINQEIQDTSSVLESKTSKYVEMFKALEVQGREAVLLLLQSNGIPMKEVDSVIKSSPVKVTFLDNYNAKHQIIPDEPVIKPEPPNSAESMGMQPFIIPEEPKKVVDTQAELNHGHGPTAYEKGFAKGAQSSNKLKSQLQYILKLLLKSIPESNSVSNSPNGSRIESVAVPNKPVVDDASNTITEKLDLEPVFKLLEHKVEALGDLMLQTSTNAAMFHKYGTVWKDVTNILKAQEHNLLFQISNSIPGADNLNSNIADTLTRTMNEIRMIIVSLNDSKDILSFHKKNSPLIKVLDNELMSILQALQVVPTNDTLQQQYISIAVQLKELGCLQHLKAVTPEFNNSSFTLSNGSNHVIAGEKNTDAIKVPDSPILVPSITNRKSLKEE